MNGFLLWIAQGLGAGRIPFAPGTFGSLLGIGWCALLLLPGNAACFFAGTLGGLGLSVWLCGRAEKTLRCKDPGSVVADEIAAMPLCFAGWVGIALHQTGCLPGPEQLAAGRGWLATAGIFLAFRFFDVLKPWPVYQSQSLPGGWGVTVDDALAALYVNGVVLAVHAAITVFSR